MGEQLGTIGDNKAGEKSPQLERFAENICSKQTTTTSKATSKKGLLEVALWHPHSSAARPPPAKLRTSLGSLAGGLLVRAVQFGSI